MPHVRRHRSQVRLYRVKSSGPPPPPSNENDMAHSEIAHAFVVGRTGSVTATSMAGKVEKKAFTFDQCFDWNSKQADVYNQTARKIVDSCLEGYNGAS